MPLIIFIEGGRERESAGGGGGGGGVEKEREKFRCHLRERERERELPSPQITAAFHSPYGPLTPTLHPSRHLRGRPVLLSENDVLY